MNQSRQFNGGVEDGRGGSELERLARPAVELLGDAVEIVLGTVKRL